LRQPVGEAVCIEFIDDGPGIAPELQRRVLKPFFTTRSGGTGLGLAVVRGIISAHRGEVAIESHPPKPGTTVRITLPLSEPEGVARRYPSPLALTPALACSDSLANRVGELSG